MTANTIAYWNYLETVRSNKARESLTQYQNEEANRHNLATEGLGLMNYSLAVKNQQETVRANMARETETKRSNMVRERLSALELRETQRSHLAIEHLRSNELAETARSHVANEMISASHYNRADTVAERNALVNENQLALNKRSIDSQVSLNASREKLNTQEAHLNSSTYFNRVSEQMARTRIAQSNADIAENTADYAAQLSQANLDAIQAGTNLKEKDLEYYEYNMVLNGMNTIGNLMRSMSSASGAAAAAFAY